MKPVILLLFAPLLFGANHYVRQGASGSGDGSDWTNACTDFASSCAVSSLVRGDTYFVADGSYTARAWNKAASSTLVITIQKATVASHGTATGWVDTYGDGQAVFTGENSFSTGYWTVNGVSEYGIMFDFNEGQEAAGVSATNVTLQYIDFDGITTTGNYNYSAGTKCVTITRGSANLLVSHCALHGGESLIQEGDGLTGNGTDSTGTIIEYCHVYNSRSTSASFHNNVYYNTGSSNGVFRYNRVHDYNDEGLFFTGWEGGSTGWKVYGNVFWADGGEQNPRGIEIRQDYSYSGIELYNNTFVNLGVGGFLNRAPENGQACTSCIATNNLSYASPNTVGDMTASNNTADSTNRFVSIAGDDFHLTAGLAGASLSSPYNIDIEGNTRGGDGTFDRGAYEFGVATATQSKVITGSAVISGNVK